MVGLRPRPLPGGHHYDNLSAITIAMAITTAMAITNAMAIASPPRTKTEYAYHHRQTRLFSCRLFLLLPVRLFTPLPPFYPLVLLLSVRRVPPLTLSRIQPLPQVLPLPSCCNSLGSGQAQRRLAPGVALQEPTRVFENPSSHAARSPQPHAATPCAMHAARHISLSRFLGSC